MPEFLSPTDVANRACQHVGVRQLDPVLGFSDGSKAAKEISFCYGKLRRAELRRNIWVFATRLTAIRAIDTNTLILAPTLWVQSSTYFLGSVVSDQTGTLWESIIRDNTANQPQGSPSAWQPYFGPMTASLYDSSQAYYSGELVYTAAGDGTYNVYKSLINSNSVHPALPNEWSTSTVYYKDQVVQVFPAWSSLTTYSQGQTVTYTDGNTYSSLVNSNLNNIPSATVGTDWALVPILTLQTQTVPITGANMITQPMTSPVNEWAQATTYSSGSFVMFNGSEYLSIANNNTGNFPNVSGSTFWVAVSGGTLYISLIDLNLNNNPANAAAAWSSSTTYSSGNFAAASDGNTYKSLANSNLNNNPVTDGGVHWQLIALTAWTSTFTQGGGNSQWLQIGGAASPSGVALTALNITYPIGCGPVSQAQTKNVYRLPAGYLRRANQDPKAGGFSWLGAPGQMIYRDWTFVGNYLTTMDSNPIVFRFVADVQDVTQMDDMFCELLAARIGIEVCEPVTQSKTKIDTIASVYKQFGTEARTVNAIEVGAEEESLDDYLACRI